ncbi:alpha/beta fold hydrolase [Ilumatobacter nonamiensis]|uniref:alpha/beta fold hydrolase n=1 Tax=Ilumatobacter nonamiensis TaxID=467093 RepID=UPI0003492BB0|nr:alpha/beta fold hydrolase [Ilumatobacter nonamiensis]
MTYIRSSDGVRIHYSKTGRPGAPPVLFIQGLGAAKSGWALQRLATAPWYQAIALDNRGAGRSDKPHTPYSLEQMADDAIAVLDHAGIDTAHVVGASMGGAISQIVAVKYPERTRSITLACTAGTNHPWREDLLVEWSENAKQGGMGMMSREAMRWVIGPRSFRRLLPAMGWLGPLALGRPSHAFSNQVDAIMNVDTSMVDELENIDVPVLVLVGNQDILTPRGDSEELADRIPTAELAVISGAAHGFMIEHASTFNRVLLEFLGRAETAWQRRVAETGSDTLKSA